jgi:cation diffusion facilitator CzcD-associated flavoprotein CzcO
VTSQPISTRLVKLFQRCRKHVSDSTIHQFSWAPNPNWSAFFAPQKEIQAYFNAVADQHHLWPYIKLSHKVVDARWIEERQVWQVRIVKTDGRDLVISSPGLSEGETETSWVEECDVFVNACGFFNNWKWPDIPGRETFAGRMLHTAYWPTDADKDIDGKIVSIIGNGSSGVQVLPAVLSRAEKIYYHIRNPTWITPRMAEKFAGPKGTTLVFSEEQKRQWRDHPEEYLQYRKAIESNLNERFIMYMDHTPAQQAARKACLENLRDELAAKPELLDLLTPDYAVG